MLNPTMRPGQRTRWWFLSPSCLIDRFLDHVEKLSGFVLPAEAANPPIAIRIEVRVKRPSA